jgi:hypothetical protein
MSENQQPPATSGGGIGTRSMEIVTALLVFAFGSLVLFDSIRLGFRWVEDGPQAGYFPFYIGLIICISSAAISCQALFGRAAKSGKVFVEWQSLRQVLSVLLPALLYVGGIQLIGLYVASAIYIAGFMMWIGSYGWLRSALIGLGVSAVAFVTFEVWFQIPLYKGAFDPLAFLGY